MKRSKQEKPDPLAKELLHLSEQFRAANFWFDIASFEPFLIFEEGAERPLLAAIRGTSGEAQGLIISSDPRGANALREWLEREDVAESEAEAEPRFDLLTLTYVKLQFAEPWVRSFAESAGVRGDGTRLVPAFAAKEARAPRRHLRRAEMRTFAAALRAILAAHAAGALHPIPFPRGEHRMLCVRADRESKFVRAELVPIADWFAPEPPLAVPLPLPAELSSLPRIEDDLLIAGYESPRPSGGGAAITVTLRSFQLDATIARRTVPAGDVAAIGEILATAFRARAGDESQWFGLPDRVIFASPRWHAAYERALRALGIEPVLDPDHPGSESADGARRADLPEWREIERGELAWCSRYAEEKLHCRETLEDYFEAHDYPHEAAATWGEDALAASYYDWLFCDYWPEEVDAPYIDQRLEEGHLEAAQRHFYESRRDSIVSLFRVSAVHSEDCVEVEDACDGTTYTIADGALATFFEDDVWLMLRLIPEPVRGSYFASFAGPTVTGEMKESVVRDLAKIEERGKDLDQRELRAVFFGRMWARAAEETEAAEREEREEKRDEDAHVPLDEFDYETINASFTVENFAALVRALAARPDMEVEREDGEELEEGQEFDPEWMWWTWVDPLARDAVGPLRERGFLSYVEGKLTVGVRTREMLGEIREILEGVEGVRFEGER